MAFFPAFGAERDLTTLSFEELLTVEVQTVEGASRFAQAVEDAPARIDIYTAEEIRRFGFRTIADILNSLGGVFVSYDRNYNYFGTRGFVRAGELNSRLMMLIDGNRLGDPVYGSSPIGYDLPLDLDLIEKIEIIRGPCSALYGDNAFFGVINIHTRKGNSLPQQGEIAAQVGTHGMGGGRISWVEKGEKSELLFSHSIMGSNGAEKLFFPAFNDPATNFGVAENRDWGQDSDTFLRFRRGPWTFEAIHGRYLKGVPTAPYGTLFNDPDTKTNDSFNHLALHYHGEYSHDRKLEARFVTGGLDFSGEYPFDNANPGDPLDRVINMDNGAGRRAQFELSLSGKTGPHHWAGGFEIANIWKRKLTNWDTVVNTDQNFPQNTSGIFLENEWKVRRNLALSAGIRWDDMDDEGRFANPRYAVVWHPTPKSTLKVLHGKAYRLPNTYERYFVDRVTKTTPLIKAERTTTTEAIYEKHFGKGWCANLSGYQYKLLNLLSQQEDPADNMLFYIGDQEVNGRALEVGLEKRWNPGKWVRANVSWHRTWYPGTGLSLTNSVSRLGRFHAMFPFLQNKFHTGLEVLYCSSRQTELGTTAPSYMKTNLTLVRSLKHLGVDLSLSVYNLFDVRIYDSASTEHTQDVIRQDGRQLRLKAEVQF